MRVLGIWPWQLSNLSFGWPEALVLLLAVPVLVGLYVWMQKRRRKYAVRYASVSLVREAVGRGPGVRRHIPAAMYLVAVTAMVFALARPEATHPSTVTTGVVLLAVDVSGSMQAEDVEPSRMEATKKAIREFVQKQPEGVKIGIVSFSDFGALVAPPTRDRKVVIEAVNRLQPQTGTNIGGGLQVALDAIYQEFDQAAPKRSSSGSFPVAPGFGQPSQGAPADVPKVPPASVILLSDGESNRGPSPLSVAEEAVAAGVKVNTVGIGTTEGTVLRIQGRSILTRLDESTLQAVAEATGGQYYSAEDESQLKNVYGQLAREQQTEERRSELTYAMTGLALVISLIAGAFSLAWFNRLP